jgi:3'-5' exonuclease
MLHRTPLEHLLVIDIETVSNVAEFAQLSPEWQELWEEKTARTLPENTSPAEFYQQRAAILAEFGKVVCISIGYFKKVEGTYQFRVKSIANRDEALLLQNFASTLQQLEAVHQKWCLAGHNIREFDIPFLCRRFLINALPIPACLDLQNVKPWEQNVLDTFQLWRFGDFKHYTSLKLLAACFGVPSPKGDIDGSMVGKVFWMENDLDRIAAYCQRDVATVANILLRMRGAAMLQDNQIVFV